MSDTTDDAGAKRELFNALELGLDARQFLGSKIGQYVAKRAMDEMYAATQQLADVDPFDHKTIVRLQQENKVASAALSWLAQAIEASPIEFGDWSAPLHISYGVREITADIEPETLVAEADAAMFAAKRARSAALPIATGGAAG